MHLKLLRISTIVIVLLSAMPLACAQNNVYKINDSLYELYKKSVKVLKSPKALTYIDSMYSESVRLHDKKAQCIAQSLKLRNLLAQKDAKVWPKMREECEKLRTISRSTGYMQYYYYSYQLEVTWLLNARLSARALNVVEQLKNEAFTNNDKNGIYNSYRSLGDVYFSRNNYEEAVKNYKLALDFILENMPEQSPSDAYCTLANAMKNCDMDKESLVKALEYAKKAEATSKLVTNTVKALEVQAMLQYMLDRIDKFIETYNRVVAIEKKNNLSPMTSANLYLRIYKSVLDKDFDRANSYCEHLFPAEKYFMISRVEVERGNYKKAYEFYRHSVSIRDSIHNSLLLNDIAEFNAQLGNERLRSQNALLNLSNTNLQLKQVEQQMNLERQLSRNQSLILRNNELEMKSMKTASDLANMRAAKVSAEHKRDRADYDKQRAVYKMRTFRLTAIGLVLLVMVVFMVYIYIRRRKTMAAMREKNLHLEEANIRVEKALAEAVEARKRAEEANMMKVRFIQNMSHEVRTPLNSILGFSQLLSESGSELSDDERKEFSRLVEQNSLLLTSMVNDILNVSDLESGNSVLHPSLVACNVVGRDALSMVTHRQPKGVKLIFTTDVADDFCIYADRQRMEQVLINFLTNAQKYTEEGEIRLHCSSSETPGMVTYSVTDTGSGVPPEMANAIFERFTKLDSFKQGCGLGLNICRMIAEQMHGEVKLDTSYSGGARFVFTLPITLAPKE